MLDGFLFVKENSQGDLIRGLAFGNSAGDDDIPYKMDWRCCPPRDILLSNS
jgi:hypothetical protein